MGRQHYRHVAAILIYGNQDSAWNRLNDAVGGCSRSPAGRAHVFAPRNSRKHALDWTKKFIASPILVVRRTDLHSYPARTFVTRATLRGPVSENCFCAAKCSEA